MVPSAACPPLPHLSSEVRAVSMPSSPWSPHQSLPLLFLVEKKKSPEVPAELFGHSSQLLAGRAHTQWYAQHPLWQLRHPPAWRPEGSRAAAAVCSEQMAHIKGK